jgi:hypothetical protein
VSKSVSMLKIAIKINGFLDLPGETVGRCIKSKGMGRVYIAVQLCSCSCAAVAVQLCSHN